MQPRLPLVTLGFSDLGKARAVEPLQDNLWSASSGSFPDPDGHLRAVPWSPFFPPDEQGDLFLPDNLT